jgi:hypothetical protein
MQIVKTACRRDNYLTYMTNLCLEDENDGEEDEEHEEVYAEDYDDTEAPPLPPFMKPVPPPTSAPAFVDRTKHIVRNPLCWRSTKLLLKVPKREIFVT